MTREEAQAYIDAAKGCELEAALALAYDRVNFGPAPEAIEVHHAFYMLRDAFGLLAPSWEDTRVEMRKRGWYDDKRIDKGQP